MSTRGGLVDASNAIKHLREWLKQDLSREVSRGHSTMAVANRITDDQRWTYGITDTQIPERRSIAERTLANIIPFIERELFLKVNRAKTTVSHVSKIKYLGYAFYRNREKCRFRVHPKTVRKMKDRIREITRKSKGWGNDYRRQKLAEYVRGWINYYKLADMKGLMTVTET